MPLLCSQCDKVLPRKEFSASQLSKSEARRCKACIDQCGGAAVEDGGNEDWFWGEPPSPITPQSFPNTNTSTNETFPSVSPTTSPNTTVTTFSTSAEPFYPKGAAAQQSQQPSVAQNRSKAAKPKTAASSRDEEIPAATSSPPTSVDNHNAGCAGLQPSEYEDELELICGMYSDEISILQEEEENGNGGKTKQQPPRGSVRMELRLGEGFLLELEIPARGYPESRKPVVAVKEGVNVAYTAQLERMISTAIEEDIEVGMPMLVLIVSLCQAKVAEINEVIELETNEKREARAEELRQFQEAELEMFSSGIDIKQGEAISDRKSKFVAHIAEVHSEEDAMNVVRELRCNKSIASAAHPTIWAFRIRDEKTGRMNYDTDDDGETGASRKLLFLLDQADISNHIVVVTRWFGGILLGPDRFKHIFDCAKEAFVTHGVLTK